MYAQRKMRGAYLICSRITKIYFCCVNDFISLSISIGSLTFLLLILLLLNILTHHQHSSYQITLNAVGLASQKCLNIIFGIGICSGPVGYGTAPGPGP